ncbi:MAG: GNAT family N-acetyltransferase [bacterium]|nr:GNAT family N-acetyltransferase [bacterium]
MNLELKTHYWDDAEAWEAFRKFIVDIFGLDFAQWKSCGYWDHAFTPFSFFDGDRLVASVCIYLLDAVVNGKNTCIAQISSVGTLPEWRRKGLSRQLTDIGLQWAQGKHDGLFLFAAEEAIPYYEHCGFRAVDEFVETTRIRPVSNRAGAVKLDPGVEQDLDRIYEYARTRTPVSDRFSFLNAKLVMFHVLYRLRACIFEIPDLDCLVFCERSRGILSVFDIVGQRVPGFEEIYPYVAGENDAVVEFHFAADKLGLTDTATRKLIGNNPFVRGAFPIDRPVFPFTARA